MPRSASMDAVTKAKFGSRAKSDTYITEFGIIRAVLAKTEKLGKLRVLDLCAGPGTWGQVAHKVLTQRGQSFEIVGTDINPAFQKTPWHDQWITGDVLEWEPEEPFDLILSNPPFDKRVLLPIITRSLTWLRDSSSEAYFLTPISFLGSQGRLKFFEEHMPLEINTLVPRPSYFRMITGVRATDTDEANIVCFDRRNHPFSMWRPMTYEETGYEDEFKLNPNFPVARAIFEASRVPLGGLAWDDLPSLLAARMFNEAWFEAPGRIFDDLSARREMRLKVDPGADEILIRIVTEQKEEERSISIGDTFDETD